MLIQFIVSALMLKEVNLSYYSVEMLNYRFISYFHISLPPCSDRRAGF